MRIGDRGAYSEVKGDLAVLAGRVGEEASLFVGGDLVGEGGGGGEGGEGDGRGQRPEGLETHCGQRVDEKDERVKMKLVIVMQSAAYPFLPFRRRGRGGPFARC
jgi:hypothetical protein